jgi:hypothetical protein
MRTASSPRTLPTAEETDSRRQWVTAEVGRCPRTIASRKRHGSQGPGRNNLARRAAKDGRS